jgi:ribokinase
VAFINVFEDIVENQIIVVSGANAFVESQQVSKESLNHIDILLSQLEVPSEQIEDLFIRAKGSCFRVLNTAPAVPISEELIKNTDLLVMNETELETLSGETLESQNIDSIISSIKGLSLKNHQSIIITLGSQGVYVCQDQKGELINGHEVHAIDTTGSGDCFIGALASNYLETENLYEAALFGNKAAALSTTKKGASLSMPTQDEVENWFQTF